MHAVAMNGKCYLIPHDARSLAGKVIAEKWARLKGAELLGWQLLSLGIVVAGYKTANANEVEVISDVIPAAQELGPEIGCLRLRIRGITPYVQNRFVWPMLRDIV